jgi:carbamoyl-phosphate synthase large subunit
VVAARIPDPSIGAERYLAEVEAAVRRERPAVVLPLSESALVILAGWASPTGARVAAPSAAQLAWLGDKVLLGRLAARVGLASPGGVVVEAGCPVPDLPSLPSVVKPRRSVTLAADGPRYLPAALAKTPGQRAHAVGHALATTGAALIDPLVRGRRWHLHAWRSADGSGGMAARVLRSWPPETGMTCASRVEPPPAGALEGVLSLLGGVGYEGVASADLIEVEKGPPILLDVNLRLPFSLGEAVRAGLDTPRIAVDIALGRPVRAAAPPRPARYHWLAGEARWMLACGRLGESAALARALLDPDAVVDPLVRGRVGAGLADLARAAVRAATSGTRWPRGRARA